ncbi:ferredoxin--NADP reductase [Basilea psittacipulmonis]|uniref:ferredoxin--NADP(+) reductase n=1 Tax=Basilea psittacipulmonis DSM 24701 TaxID=1072685 RepID=A0A077DFM3_9BURK|nr:ferredoxin--NADP reductase [Basilea psittacipulmonis]AIL32157.1 hypothetical protein IX83_01420 [Basilea psittacipulmonis DSM 24701]
MTYYTEKVLDIKWWVPNHLFTLTTTYPKEMTFLPGQFARLGLPSEAGKEPDIWRAYSMVNHPSEQALSFYSIVVPDGAFSPKLASLKSGDTIYIGKQVFGFLTLDRFPNGGKTLWLMSTGTGLSAFISILKDEKTWQRFEQVVLVHGVRHANELSYQDEIRDATHACAGRFTYLPLVTREAYQSFPQARITTMIEQDAWKKHTGLELRAEHDCVMLCGNPEMLTQARKMLSEMGFQAERRGVPGNLAVEKYW